MEGCDGRSSSLVVVCTYPLLEQGVYRLLLPPTEYASHIHDALHSFFDIVALLLTHSMTSHSSTHPLTIDSMCFH